MPWCRDVAAGEDLELAQKGLRLDAAMRFHQADDHVDRFCAALAAASSIA